MAEFTWPATYGATLSMKPRVASSRFGDGYEQRVADGLNSKLRSWRLEFMNRPLALADAIEGFLDARGGVESFDWQPPRGGPGKWVCREWTSAQTSPQHWSISCTFEEVPE